MGKWVHRLSDIDPENRSAVCAACGPVRIWRVTRSGRPAWRCSVSKAASRGSHGSKRHGLGDDEARALIASCEACAICGTRERLVVDHNHKTRRVRGVLCHGCNVGLGFFRDDPVLLTAAAGYVLSSP